MDDIVLRAMQKWPDVPSVYGWLGLDRRGNWSLKGQRITNPAITQFIGRNYGRDEQSRWYFQNGPQKVFVTLAYTPFVYRTQREADGALGLVAHTGVASGQPQQLLLDEVGTALLDAETGVGVIHDQDLPTLTDSLVGPDSKRLADSVLERLLERRTPALTGVLLQLGSRRIPVALIESVAVPERFGFDPNPRPAPGEPEC